MCTIAKSVTFALSSHNARFYLVYLNTKTMQRGRTAPKPNITVKVRFSRTPRQGDRCHLKSGLELDLDFDPVLRGLIRGRQLYLSVERTSVLRSVRGWRRLTLIVLMWRIGWAHNNARKLRIDRWDVFVTVHPWYNYINNQLDATIPVY